jgi:hypothetical protein
MKIHFGLIARCRCPLVFEPGNAQFLVNTGRSQVKPHPATLSVRQVTPPALRVLRATTAIFPRLIGMIGP